MKRTTEWATVLLLVIAAGSIDSIIDIALRHIP